MTINEAQRIRREFYSITNPKEDDFFRYTEALKFLIEETKDPDYMVELGVGEIRVEIPDIESRIGELEEEIDEIRTTEPYIYRDLLENDEAVARKMSELEEELAKYRRYRGELEAAAVREIVL